METIKGIRIILHNENEIKENVFFGFDDENKENLSLSIVKEFEEIYFNDDEHYIYYGFINSLYNDIKINEWKKRYEGTIEAVNIEWEIILEYFDGKIVSYSGKNAFPDNFNDFIKLCYEVEIFYDYNEYDYKDLENIQNDSDYDKFLEEVELLESVIKCPKCDSNNIYHVSPLGYTFLCGQCGDNFEYTIDDLSKDLQKSKKDNKKIN